MKDPVDIAVGHRLRARRRLLGFSQEALGSTCGVTFQQIHKYETAGCRISANMLWRMACVLDVEMGYFFVGLPADRKPAHNGRAPGKARQVQPGIHPELCEGGASDEAG